MQQIYAKIKRNSKYFYQNEMAKRDCKLSFQVAVKDVGRDGYCIMGGPGKYYRLANLNLFVIDKGIEIIIR